LVFTYGGIDYVLSDILIKYIGLALIAVVFLPFLAVSILLDTLEGK